MAAPMKTGVASITPTSVIPTFVANRQPVQDLAVGLPPRHELIHQSHEAGVVTGFEQVSHLVDDNVFEAFDRLSSQIGIQSNYSHAMIAATPFCLHSLNEEPLQPYLHQSLPSFNHRRDGVRRGTDAAKRQAILEEWQLRNALQAGVGGHRLEAP